MNLLIVGEGGVGKSSYLERLKNKNIKDMHIPTLGVDTGIICYKGKKWTIWDTSGTDKFVGLKEGYYLGKDCAIIMISDSILSYNSVEKFKNIILSICGNIPIVIVINKCELNNADINYKNLKKKENNIILVSCKENISIYEPLDMLIRMIGI